MRLLAMLCVFGLVACSGGSGDGAPAAGGLRFLMASQEGLTEVTFGGPTRVLLKWNDQSYPLDPAISPDGKSLAFGLQPPAKAGAGGSVDFGSDIYVASRQGKDARKVARHQRVAEFLRAPVWISDTELLYTYRGRGAGGSGSDVRIERLDVKTGKSVRFIDSAVDPSVSRDGKWVVYVGVDPATQEEALLLASLDLSVKRTLVAASGKLALFSSQVFSPDGSKVAFAAIDLEQLQPGGLSAPGRLGVYAAPHPFAGDVWVVNADGSGLKRLAEIAENMPSLTWSGDGSTVYALGGGAWWKIDAATGLAEQMAAGIPQAQIVWLSGP